MKLFSSPYLLKSKTGQMDRKGALLKVVFEDDSTGYADCHPWTTNKDEDLENQLSLLSQGKTTRLTDRTLHFARLDATARAIGINLLDDLVIPKSHWFIPSILQYDEKEIQNQIDLGSLFFKAKVGNNWSEEFKQIQKLVKAHPQIKLRLDFNLKLSPIEFFSICDSLQSLGNALDYCEDPFPFEKTAWQEVQKRGIRLACDSQSQQAMDSPEAASIIVIKPAIQDEAIFLSSLKPTQKLVITSYLDHPLGQVAAAYIAGLCFEKAPNSLERCGLLSHYVYEPNPFSKMLMVKDASLLPVAGTGFGFDTLLAALDWKPL